MRVGVSPQCTMLAACPLLEMQRWKARNTSWLFTTAENDVKEQEEQGMMCVKKKTKKNVGDYLEQGEGWKRC